MLQQAVRMDRPVQAYDRWIKQIPQDYQKYILDKHTTNTALISDDPERLALLKHYHSLMPLAQESHKPIFHLKPADGAIGAHMQSVQDAYLNFEKLARAIAKRAKISLP